MYRPAPAAEPVVLQVLDDLRRIVAVLRTSSRAAQQRLGVTGAQLFVLRALAEAPSQSLNQLAVRTRTHQSTVSVVVKRLVARGLVSRATRAGDARSVELTATRKGRSLLGKAPHAAQERLIRAIEGMPAARRERLAACLHDLTFALHLHDEQPAMFFEDEDDENKARKRGS
jgi:DNA-binding MarR family transcriptional regulator